MLTTPSLFKNIVLLLALLSLTACETASRADRVEKIARETVVTRHNPSLAEFDPSSPFTVGNGAFAFTADITGLQSYADIYYEQGIPLETKARWSWHSRANPQQFSLTDSYETFQAYGREVAFPTNMDSEAGRWLRQNPHDLPLARIGFSLHGKKLSGVPAGIKQQLNLWSGILQSEFVLEEKKVAVTTLVDNSNDSVGASVQSELLKDQTLAVDMHFPRGYKLDKKNTPDLDFINTNTHSSKIIYRLDNGVILQRKIDDAGHFVFVQWRGKAKLRKISEHHYRLLSNDDNSELFFNITFSQDLPKADTLDFQALTARVSNSWRTFWQQGAFVDFSGSTNPKAMELERRIILSRYLMAVQERGIK